MSKRESEYDACTIFPPNHPRHPGNGKRMGGGERLDQYSCFLYVLSESSIFSLSDLLIERIFNSLFEKTETSSSFKKYFRTCNIARNNEINQIGGFFYLRPFRFSLSKDKEAFFTFIRDEIKSLMERFSELCKMESQKEKRSEKPLAKEREHDIFESMVTTSHSGESSSEIKDHIEDRDELKPLEITYDKNELEPDNPNTNKVFMF